MTIEEAKQILRSCSQGFDSGNELGDAIDRVLDGFSDLENEVEIYKTAFVQKEAELIAAKVAAFDMLRRGMG